jgi:basic membrane lipoprotein Med (substrate-binding protein (PBP1-ABC) superfamily)
MKFVLVFLLCFIAVSSLAQDSWKASLDKKVLLNTSDEDEKQNILKISAGDLIKSKNFTLNYKESTPQKGWERTIRLYDEKDNELKKQIGMKLSLKTSQLKALLSQYKTVKIYTINSPTDPKLKERVRIRRVHLCTLILQE